MHLLQTRFVLDGGPKNTPETYGRGSGHRGTLAFMQGMWTISHFKSLRVTCLIALPRQKVVVADPGAQLTSTCPIGLEV